MSPVRKSCTANASKHIAMMHMHMHYSSYHCMHSSFVSISVALCYSVAVHSVIGCVVVASNDVICCFLMAAYDMCCFHANPRSSLADDCQMLIICVQIVI